MAKNEKINMPTSTAGITRYFDDYKSKIQFKPGHVIVMCMVIMAIIIILHLFGGSWLGL